VWIKRDDELGLGVGGSKVRKYASVVAHACHHRPQYVVVEGSLNSNNVLGLLPLLHSYGLQVALAVPHSHSPHLGNAPWVHAMCQGHVLHANTTAGMEMPYYQQLLESESIFVVREGACQVEALPGALTLAQEILTLLAQSKEPIDRIYIDAGTGLSAAALLLGLRYASIHIPVYITSIACKAGELVNTLNRLFVDWQHFTQANATIVPSNYEVLTPTTARSFGSVNASIKSEWLAQMDALRMPLDLTYTAKHFLTAKIHLETQPCGGAVVVNCGSWLAARNHSHLLPTVV
jgi:1-aminocyclopropane-1-carboxylate deaminase/D-cysteine desulfhydrase-like pyridoxal-dependent ACC family enzyme